jgi:hypothetical protein
MLKVHRLLGCSILVAGAALAACGAGEAGDESETTGEAVAAISEVPADVSCITIDVEGSRLVTQRFDVTPGESSAFSMTGLPVGDVIFKGSAHPVACANVTTASVATWISDPTPATLTAGGPATAVTLQLKRNGQATVGVSFEEADVDGGTIICPSGFGNCDGDGTNGCEADLSSSPTNCGACGNVCNLAHAVSECTFGRCAVSACRFFFADCNGNAADGCEVDLATSRTNCGDCFNVCETGTSCVDGACVPNDPCLLPPC